MSAAPLSFHFTGTVSITILSSGVIQDFGLSNPDWLGKSVSGTITMDLSAVPLSFSAPGFVQYSKTEDFPHTDWMSIALVHPDGATSTIPAAQAPDPPEAEGDDAFPALMDTASQDWFYVQRSNTNSVSFPQQTFLFELLAIGADGLALTSSADYKTVQIDPAAANHANYGFVSDYAGVDEGYLYAFTVNSLTRVTEQVPEPSTLALGGCGLLLAAAIALRRRRPAE